MRSFGENQLLSSLLVVRSHARKSVSSVTCAKKNRLEFSSVPGTVKEVICVKNRLFVEALKKAVSKRMAGARPKRKVGPGSACQQEGRNHQRRQQTLKAATAIAFSTTRLLVRWVRTSVATTPIALSRGSRKSNR